MNKRTKLTVNKGKTNHRLWREFCVDFKLKGTKTNGNEREVRVLFPFNLNTTQKERNERVFLSLISLHAFTRSSFHCKRNEERNTLIQFPPLSGYVVGIGSFFFSFVLCSTNSMEQEWRMKEWSENWTKDKEKRNTNHQPLILRSLDTLKMGTELCCFALCFSSLLIKHKRREGKRMV